MEKDADTSYTRKYEWSIDKTGDQTEITLAKDQTFELNYTVTVDADYDDNA